VGKIQIHAGGILTSTRARPPPRCTEPTFWDSIRFIKVCGRLPVRRDTTQTRSNHPDRGFGGAFVPILETNTW